MSEQRPELLSPEELRPVAENCDRVLAQLDRILLGRSELHRMVLVGLLSRGHILLEGLPGLGKTALVHAVGGILRLDYKRVQFTPDLMPGDILGTHILQDSPEGGRDMVFRPGPVFTNILLADEINRASPKTQSALLETMQEGSVTLLGQTRQLPKPFFVLASQNPIELEGTYPLPEAQLDRFLFRLLVDAVDVGTLEQIVRTRRRGQAPQPEWTMSPEELAQAFAVMDRIVMPQAVARYVSRLVAASHPDSPEAPEKVKQYVRYGASPRAAIGIAEAARGVALLAKRPTVGFEDVQKVAGAVLNHRLVLGYQARYDQVTASMVVDDLLAGVEDVAMDLPEDMEVVQGGR
jgi:MoxR-like ATPase